MLKSEIKTFPDFFGKYIELAEDIPLVSALAAPLGNTEKERINYSVFQDYRYAPDKWTVKDVLQHIVDNERVQSYRALRISRGDTTPLPGYDEKLFAKNAGVEEKGIDDIVNEYTIVRQATIALFKNMKPLDYLRFGMCNNISISALALGFVIVGHQVHHMNILRERYLIQL